MVKVNKFFIPYIILLIVIGFRGELFISFLMVLLHEGAHYIAAVYFGYSGFDLKILPIGARLKLSDLDEATLKEDLAISLAGPLFNIIIAVLFYLVNLKLQSDYLELIVKSNFSLGIFNLLPAFPLDGGRVLRNILSMKTIYRRANEITINVSIIFGYLLAVSFIILLILGIMDFNLIIIGFVVILSSYKEKERIVYIMMGDIVKKNGKFIKRKFIENKSISVYYKEDLIYILSLVDKNKYNIFTILDDKMKVLDIIYEEEVVEALKLHGNISIEEFVLVRNNYSIGEGL